MLPGPRAAAALICAALGAGACSADRPEMPPPAPAENPVDPATAGAIGGTVRFEGSPPPPEQVDMSSDPYCAGRNPDPAVRRVAVGPDSGLQHVFVYVKDGLGNLRFPVPSAPVVLDQQGCVYTPRVLGIQVGQTLEIVNSDPTLHNIHAMPASNREFNRGQSTHGQRDRHVFSTREVMVPFRCDVHRWMSAWIGVLDHPFYAVTGADGAFEIKGLPPGTYTLEAWHERLGTQTQLVTVEPKQTAAVSFTFKG